MARWWVGGTGTWDQATTTHWAASSGAAGGASVPVASDDVTFDANSGTGTVTISASAPMRSLATAGSSLTTCVHNAFVTLTIGDATAGGGGIALDLSGFGTYTLGSATSSALTFVSTATTTQTITCPKPVGNPTFNGAGGKWTLASGFTCPNLVFTLGTVSALGAVTITTTMWMSGSGVRTLNMGSGTWTLSGTGTVWDCGTVTNLTLSAASSTIAITDTSASVKTFKPGTAMVFGSLAFIGPAGGTLFMNGNSLTLQTFQVGPGRALQAYHGLIMTLATAAGWQVNGTAGSLVTINSDLAGTAWPILTTDGQPIESHYVSLKDITAPAAGGYALDSTKVSNTTNWNFYPPDASPPGNGDQGRGQVLVRSGAVGRSNW